MVNIVHTVCVVIPVIVINLGSSAISGYISLQQKVTFLLFSAISGYSSLQYKETLFHI
jgi:hypothetical protein